MPGDDGAVTKSELSRDGGPVGVGIIGTGLAFQAIHAPVLEGLAAQFAIRVLWDPDSGIAGDTARRLGARSAPNMEDLLADPSVEVVVICSPARFHAAQAIAAMRAGKRAVLVEKPLCASPEEADALAEEAMRCGVPLLVGAMHRYDPAWLAAESALAAAQFKPALVRSTMLLPPNARFEDWATEPISRAAATAAEQAPMTPDQIMQLFVLELAIHDLPMMRQLLPLGATPKVLSARLCEPFGYIVSVAVGDALLDLTAMLHGHWQTDWTMEASDRDSHLRVSFTPSFVPAGSGEMEWTTGDKTLRHQPSRQNGYQGQWQAISAMLQGTMPVPDPRVLADDFSFAFSISEQATALLAMENAA